ncbi:MAG TPA: TonB-dependent receptor, partial [Candidatus Kapabacteria bacterium]|nr:TonB-dependent receptor [Candidatus Kapabacteria bacterium]
LLFQDVLIAEHNEIIENKYLRNKKFNDSYLDLFFKTTPTGLPSSWLFADENFVYKKSEKLELIPINRTKLSRYPYFAFEGVPIYNIEDGGIDLSKFVLLPSFFYIEQERADSSRFPTISDFNNIISDTNLRKSSTSVSVGAGNQLGNLSGNLFVTHKQFKYFVSGSFLNSPGISVSDKIAPEARTQLNYLKNSDFSQGNFFSKIYFDNNISQVGLNAYFVGGRKSIPPIIDSADKFQKYPNFNNTILSLDFNTKFDEGIILAGNLFYNNRYSKKSVFDDSLFIAQRLPNSRDEIYFGYNYGSILAIKTSIFDVVPTNIFAIAYIRDIFNIRTKKYSIKNRFESENLQISIRQPFYFGNLSVFPTARYIVQKPLYSNKGFYMQTLKGIDYRIDINYDFADDFLLFAGVSSENSLIANEVMFQSEAIQFEKELFSNIGFRIRTPDYELTTKAFYSSLDNIIEFDEAGGNFYNNSNSISSKGIDANIKIYSDFGYILINYTYNDINRLVNFATKPKHIGEIKIYNTYEIGLRWMLEVEYFSNEYNLTDNVNNLGVKNLILMNFRMGYRIIKENELFVAAYNFLNSKYYVSQTLPGTGFSFFVGLHIHL